MDVAFGSLRLFVSGGGLRGGHKEEKVRPFSSPFFAGSRSRDSGTDAARGGRREEIGS